MAVAARRSGEFRLSWAILASVAIHVLLAWLLVMLAPLIDLMGTAMPPPREESVLRFTFGPKAEDDLAAKTGQPLPEGRPEATEPSPRSVALPTDRASARPPQEDPGRDERRSDPAPRMPRGLETREPRPELQEPVDPSREPTESRRPTALPDDPRSTLGRSQERESGTAAPSGGRQPVLDWREKVDAFGRALASRPTRPASGSSSTGARSEFSFDAPGFEASGYGVGNLTFHSRDYDWSEYARRIYWAILRAWYNRMYRTIDDFEYWASQGNWELNHADLVRFVIESNGNVSGVELIYESGCPPLDSSSVEALREVVLPPLPEDFPRDRETVDVQFIAWGPIFYAQRKVYVCDARSENCRWVPSDTLQGESRMSRIPVMREHLQRWLAADRPN